ncbi:MAG: SurA N-terminal domain-containing protein [Sphingomonadales bacterium]|nr:SurA N-terminal domain-containing protein [Sphingomonadales bacterium]MBD3772208.1 SurA N-terminal domain-containing protein [Paracoccaceae bacterium]
MLSFFRNFFKSKLGVIITLAFLALIGLAFASGDVASSGAFGGVAGGDRVAVVGKQKIGSGELSRAVTAQVEGMRQQDPTLTVPAFIAQGGLEKVLDSMIDRFALGGYAEKIGLRAGSNLVNSEIIKLPAFTGADGTFDENTYRAAIAQRGLTDKMVRSDLGNGLLAQQLLLPASYGAQIPDKFVIHYASLLKERRKGTITVIMSAPYEPKGAPTGAQLQAYYEANKKNYIRPERRVIRYATFGAAQITDRIEPTDNEIAAQYKKDAAKYAASETRSFTQLIVPTQQKAADIAKSVATGGSLEAAARSAGLQTAKIGPVDKAKLANDASQAVADAAFAAASGKLAQVARGPIGWYVVRVDQVTKIPARSLAEVRGSIADTLREQNKRKAMSDLAANIEEQIDGGTALTEVADQLGVKLASTQPLTATGQVYGKPNESAPQLLAPAIAAAFQMEDEGEPQLADVGKGDTFLIYEVSQITPSSAAPLAEITPEVTAEWRRAEGAKKAKEVADKVLARLVRGESLDKALAEEKVAGPKVDHVDLSREEIARTGQQVPAPLALFFSMAQGTSKKLEAPGDNGWFLVSLAEIVPGTMSKDDPMFKDAKTQLATSTGQEYAEQLQGAIRKEMKIERNKPAIDAVRKQLTGES